MFYTPQPCTTHALIFDTPQLSTPSPPSISHSKPGIKIHKRADPEILKLQCNLRFNCRKKIYEKIIIQPCSLWVIYILLAKIPVESLMEGVASQNVWFRPCRVSCMHYATCTNSVVTMVLYKQNFVVNFVGRCYYKINTGVSTSKLPENVGTGW